MQLTKQILRKSDLVKFISEASLSDIVELVQHVPLLTSLQWQDSFRFNHQFNQRTDILDVAIALGSTEVTSYLLSIGLKPIPENTSYFLADWLRMPIRDSDVDANKLHLLFELGARLPYQIKDQQNKNQEYECAFFLESTMRPCFVSDDIDRLNCLVESGFDPAICESIGKINTIECFLSATANYPEKQRYRSLIVERLIELGCSLSNHRKKTYSLFAKAYERCDKRLCELLIKLGYGPTNISCHIELAKTFCNFTPKMAESNFGIDEHFQFGVDSGIKLNVSDDSGGVLHWAVRNSDKERARFLLNQKIDVNCQDSTGRSPLFFAAQHGDEELVSMLLDFKADPNIVNKGRRTVIDETAKKRNVKNILNILKDAGARTAAEMLKGDDRKLASACVQTGEPWSDRFIKIIIESNDEKASLWYLICQHCQSSKSRYPSKAWLVKASNYLADIGAEYYTDIMLELLDLAQKQRTALPEDFYIDPIYDEWELYEKMFGPYVISETNTHILKGLIWLCSRCCCHELTVIVGKLASAMYEEYPEIGIRNPTLGSACVFSLSELPNKNGLDELKTLKSTVKYKRAIPKISAAISKYENF